ncbi:MAG: DUF5615 family PIN-like protein [Chitinophagales bacterium]
MKILLDENLPRKLKADFGAGYEVKTVKDIGWLGKKNGELLKFIGSSAFDYFITIDKNLRHQQNLDKIGFTIFLLLAINNRRETLQQLIEKVKEKIKSGSLEKLVEIR